MPKKKDRPPKSLTAQIEPDIRKKIFDIRVREGTSYAHMVNAGLRLWLEDHESKLRIIAGHTQIQNIL